MGETYNLPRHELLKRVLWYEKKYPPYIEKKGLHNWKNLFRKPTLYECVILIMLLMALFMWWAYSHDMEVCREIVEEYNAYYPDYTDPNYSIFEGEVENDLVE